MYAAHRFKTSFAHVAIRWALRCLMTIFIAICTQCFAAPADGVRCPGGYETQFDGNTKTLRCMRTQSAFRPAVCDPKFEDHVIYRVSKGQDQCVRISDVSSNGRNTSNEPRGRPVTCTADVSERATWQIDIDPSAQERDRCRSQLIDWIYPSQQ